MILLIESGSTNTHWRLLLPENSKPIDFHSEGINPYYQNPEEIKNSQAKVIESIKQYSIQEIHYYGTGITGEKQKEILRDLFQSTFSNVDSISIKNDLESAAIANLGEESGIACILGTGSNSGYFENGQLITQIPPLGFWLGDEGSGGHLGKSLVLAYLHRELPDEIRLIFIKRFGEMNRMDILQKAYKEEFPNRWFATFSKFLFDHRKHPYIYQLIQNSFELFAQKYLLKYPQVGFTKVHFTGSVGFYFSDILRKTMQANGITVGHISENPMAGLTLYHKKKFRNIN
ncbi:MAG: hypothetical protein RJA76_1159 [Bacteroidota bacterium]|jgi:N-acetylglucosamine kinase-like BadF-type ATPase